MPAFAEPIGVAATAVLRRHGFEEILDLPCLPAYAGQGLRYQRTEEVDTAAGSGQAWHLRSAGLDFEIIAKGWLRAGMQRCFTLGWGLVDHHQTDRLLLAQAFAPEPEPLRALGGALAGELTPLVRSAEWNVVAAGDWSCLRVAAELAGQWHG